MNIAIIDGSMSPSSSGTTLAKQIVSAMKEVDPDIETTNIGLRAIAHPLLNSVFSGFPAPEIAEAHRTLEAADAIVAVTPTYQAGVSGLFKLFCDALPDGIINDRPVLLAATGGTARHGLVIDHAMRPLFSYLGARPIRTGIYAATQDWGAPGLEQGIAEDEPLERRIRRGAHELVDTTGKLCDGRQKAAPSSQLDDFVPFDSLPGIKN